MQLNAPGFFFFLRDARSANIDSRMSGDRPSDMSVPSAPSQLK